MNVNRILMVLFALAASLALTACGGDGGLEGASTDVSHETAAASGEPSGDLTISNWPFYVDKKTIPEFQDETGIQVKYVEDVNSYEEFFAKMQPLLARGESGGRSLMVASDWLAKRMYDLGYIQKLDQDAIAPALQNLNPVASQGGDPDHQYSIPWQGGMTGLIVNTNEAPDLTSVNDLLDDPQYKGRVEIVSEMREVVPLFMKGAGIDPESATKQDWLDTIDRLEQARDAGQIRRITGNDYAKDLATGDAAAVVGWAADAYQLQADNPDLEWVMPDEGCILWWDNWVIPTGAPNPTAAYEWIRYTDEPKNQAQISAWTASITPVEGVQPILEKTAPDLAKSELIFPSADYTAKCSPSLSPPGSKQDEQEVEKAWSALTVG